MLPLKKDYQIRKNVVRKLEKNYIGLMLEYFNANVKCLNYVDGHFNAKVMFKHMTRN